MGLASCAVRGKRKLGRPGVLGVDLDGGDDQVEFVGAIDVSRHAIELGWRDGLGFGEVLEPVDSLGVVVFHQKDEALLAFGAGEQRQVVGAEVDHGGRKEPTGEEERARVFFPPPPQRRCGVSPPDSSGGGLSSQRGA
jgi:hypothetical protein